MAKLSEAARKKRREYHRKWAHDNPDKIAEAQRRFWEKKAAAAAEGAGNEQ